MALRVPVSGAFASVYYRFEDAFQVSQPENLIYPSLSPYGDDSFLAIDKFLGQGVKVTSREVKNNAQLVRGLNNIEAAASYDGQFEGEIGLEFLATGDMAFMEALMGQKSYSATQGKKVIEYTKRGIPRTIEFLLIIKNDAEDDEVGDVYILKGGVITSATFSIDNANSPLKVTMTVPYAKDIPMDKSDLPDSYTSDEEVFNASQAMAYFWNPHTRVDDPSSFNSLETVIENFSMTISHGAELIRGISSRNALDKFHKYLEYTVSLKTYYRDKERFLQKFYGSKHGNLAHGSVAPMKRVLLVVQSCEPCGEDYRRFEFEFNNVKLNTLSSAIDVEDAITETYEMLPYNCVVRAWNGGAPEPEFSVSPMHIKQGDVVVIYGANLPSGSTATITLDKDDASPVSWRTPVNCTGVVEYRIRTDPAVWTRGNHTVTLSSGEVELSQTVYVTGVGTYNSPSITVCPQHFNTVTNGNMSGVSMKGYDFSSSDCLSLTFELQNAVGGVWTKIGTEVDIKSCLDDKGGFVVDESLSVTADSVTSYPFKEYMNKVSIADGKVLKAVVKQKIGTEVETEETVEGTYTVENYIYVTDVSVVNKSTGVQNVTACGLKPELRAKLFVDGVYKGAAATDRKGEVTYLEVNTGAGEKTIEVVQDTILADGSGVLKASKKLILT